MADAIEIQSKAFDDGEEIPERYTCDGDDVSPPLQVTGVPDDAETLALVVDDPDAPGTTFTHWLAWNVPATQSELPENVPQRARADPLGSGRQGSNDFGRTGYGGPCPPEGHGDHTYRFRIFALDTTLELSPGSNRDQLEDAMDGHVVAEGRLTGTYGR